MTDPAPRPVPVRRIFWENILALASVHLLGLAGVFYAIFVAFSWWTLGLSALWFGLCMLATTGGYHRCFAHKSYRSTWPVRLFYVLFGAAAGQASVLNWVSDHRSHHAKTDHEGDPYNIRRGFWWAHVGWLFWRNDASAGRPHVADLEADGLVRFQDRYYLPLLFAIGFLAPALLAWSWGDFVGGLLLAGFLRLMLEYQATFSINSLAHTIGARPYSTSVSARDSFITAILTLGEGYHNFHHRFPSDYRNGVRFFHYDPTKWWVWALSKVGLTSDLHRVPADAIRKAREAARHDPPAAP